MTNLLSICSRYRLRSPTAEQVFADRPGVETASAGLAPDADEAITPEPLDWADVIFVMERAPLALPDVIRDPAPLPAVPVAHPRHLHRHRHPPA